MSILKNIILLLVALAISKPSELFAQEKFERETTIKVEEVPAPAVAFVEAIQEKPEVKWIKEQSQTAISIEAKFIYQDKEYSIEFDTLGVIQDAEYLIPKETIESKLLKKIESQLDSKFSLWNYAKIQMQYKGDSDIILSSIINDTAHEALTIAYEIVVQGVKDQEAALYQLTFDQNGKLYEAERFVRKIAD